MSERFIKKKYGWNLESIFTQKLLYLHDFVIYFSELCYRTNGGLGMELSLKERQKALKVTLTMLLVACTCLLYLGYRLCMYY